LYVQLPETQGGLGGSVCYLTTKTKLQTPRLLQIQQERNLQNVSLEDVHTLSVPTVDVLLNILDNHVPAFIETIARTPSRKPVKLLIIDALAELFHLVEKVSTASLVERSQQLTRVSALLHRIADRYQIGVVVLNEVLDAFDNYAVDSEKSEGGLLVYSEQARWFNRAHSVYGENQKEAALGLVWSNQINARVMLSRTRRRRYIKDTEEENKQKRRKTEGETDGESKSGDPLSEREPSLIRRLTVIFNSAGPPTSCDYVVTSAGVRGIPSEERPPQARVHEWSQPEVNSQPEPFNVLPDYSSQPAAQSQTPVALSSQTVIPSSQEGEYDDQLWVDEEFYESVDWDNLELTLLKSQEAAN